MSHLPFDERHFTLIPRGATPEYFRAQTRRQFFGHMAKGLGGAALAAMMNNSLSGALSLGSSTSPQLVTRRPLPHMAPKAKRAIYLFMGGAPSQMDMFDYKPQIADKYDADLPPSILGAGQRNASNIRQARLPVVPTPYKFKQYGKSGAWVSDLLPWTSKIVDDIAIIKSMQTDILNHDASVTFLLTGNAVAGKPSMGAWISYGLGKISENLPSFVVMVSKTTVTDGNQAVLPNFYGSGFLPVAHAGVSLRSEGDPVLFLKDPKGLSRSARRAMIEGVEEMNAAAYAEIGDPAILSRIQEYELAFQMQTAIPELADLSDESPETFELYGPRSRIPGTFAHQCLLARRMAERGVRFTQIFNKGWDSHNNLPKNLPVLCEDVDRPCYALITDLKRRGMLDDTLVIWGGEFGRTIYCQGTLKEGDFGRDHHGKCFITWLSGGGVKPGIVYGETDDYSYNSIQDPVHVRDLNATILHQLGLDHNRLTFKFDGLEQKLTGTTPAKVVRGILA